MVGPDLSAPMARSQKKWLKRRTGGKSQRIARSERSIGPSSSQKKARVGERNGGDPGAQPAERQVGGRIREVREKAAMDGSTEKVDGTRRVAAEVVPAIRTHPPHYAWTVACLF